MISSKFGERKNLNKRRKGERGKKNMGKTNGRREKRR